MFYVSWHPGKGGLFRDWHYDHVLSTGDFDEFFVIGGFTGSSGLTTTAPTSLADWESRIPEFDAKTDQIITVNMSVSLINGNARNYVRTGDGNDQIIGGAKEDTIRGGAGDDTINGRAGNDLITGGMGRDTLTGGAGYDTFSGTASDLAGDIITDIEDGDRILVTEGTLQSASLNGNILSYIVDDTAYTMTLDGLTGMISVANNVISYDALPTVLSINRIGASSTNAASFSYRATFSESVTGVDPGDFILTATGLTGAAITQVSGSGNTYTVTVNGGTGSGTLRLDLKAAGTGITDATENAINGGFSSGQEFNIDYLAPDTTITAAPPTISSASSATFTFSANESGVRYQWSLDGSAFSAGTSPLNLTGLADGSHTIAIRAIDQVGNVDPNPATYTWTVDTTAPSAPVILSPANGAATNNNAPSIAGTAEAGATITIFVDGSAVGTTTANGGGNWSFNVPTSLAEGAHTLRVRATDAAGNTSADSNTVNAIVDTQAPALAITSGSSTDDDTPVISGTAETGAAIRLMVGGATFITTATNGTWRIDLGVAVPASGSLSLNTSGTNLVSVTAIDAVGNVASAVTQMLTIDSNDPPTGAVMISGQPVKGETLRASHTLGDADGLGPIFYQWQADGVNISGAAGATFTVTQAQVGKVITVKASYTDNGGREESVTSDATDFVLLVPNPTVTPNGKGGVNITIADLSQLTSALGTSGADHVLYGGSGKLTLPGNIENVTLIGGNGGAVGNALDNALTGSTGHNILLGGSGHDRLHGGTGNDRVQGGSGNDRLDGDAGHDALWGGTGADRLDGGSGNDTLKGDGSNDWLVGGLGRDKLWGGSGRDVFDFNAVQESKPGSQRDIICDFQSGRDKIDLRGIDAHDLRKGNQAFVWTGKTVPFVGHDDGALFLSAAFTGRAGELRYAKGMLIGDTDGDRGADFEIKIVGAFAAGDVIL